MIELLLNQTLIQVDGVAPNLSVLDWLRTNKDLKGTKEGCASGDCGACTVVIGEAINDRWQYKTVNACLMLLGNLHGKHLITVEALTADKTLSLESLHPVQRALVECHGSQCGFCTPGFIMSMFALYTNNPKYPGDDVVIGQLGGNLCRCTGYRPIVDACRYMYELPRANDAFTEAAQAFLHSHTAQSASLICGDQKFFLPQTLTELLQLKNDYPDAKLVAGGTDLSLEFTQMLKHYEVIISVVHVAEMRYVEMIPQGLSIGAATPYTEFVPELCKIYPEAYEMFHRLGSAQVRNAATLGGSFGNASPIGDPAPLLIALNAVVVVASVQGERFFSAAEFFLDYRKTRLSTDEVIIRFELPPRPEALVVSCYKVSKRIEDDISAVMMVIAFERDGQMMRHVKTGFGGMAAIPVNAAKLEAALEGKPFTLDELKAAASMLDLDFKPMSDVRASSEYRLMVCKNLLERCWLENSGDTVARVSHAAL